MDHWSALPSRTTCMLSKKSLKLINQSTNKPTNQQTNQSGSQSINQSINQSIDRSIDWSVDQSINRSINQSINRSVGRSVNQYARENSLQFFGFRHAAVSERRVRSDQRRTESTLSTNRQSQLESEYVTDFKDGARVDAVDVIANKAARRWGTKPSTTD